MIRPGSRSVRRLVLLPVVVALLTGCASVPPGEYRAGAFLHRDPTYSFRVPDGWRRAVAEDIESVGYVRLDLKFVTGEQRAQFLRNKWRAMNNADSFLISSGGAAIMVFSTPNPDGFRLPDRGALTEKEKDVLLTAVTKSVEDRLKKDGATVQSAALVEYGPLPAVLVKTRSRALPTMRFLVFMGPSRVVVTHVGIPGNDDEGLPGFEELAKSFRFE